MLCIVFSVSLASLIADTERLLASSTLTRDIDADHTTSAQPLYNAATRIASPGRSQHSFSQRPSSPIVQVRIHSPAPPSHNRPAPSTTVPLFSPSSEFDQSTASIQRSYHTTATSGRTGRRSFDTSSSSAAGDDQRAGDVDITVEYDEDDPAGSPRVDIRAHSPLSDDRPGRASPSLLVSISPVQSSASSSSASLSASFTHLNKLLLNNGFAPVSRHPRPPPPPLAASASTVSLPPCFTLLSTFADVLFEYGKRGQLVHELMTRSRRVRRSGCCWTGSSRGSTSCWRSG